MPLDETSAALVAEIDKFLCRIGTEITDPAEARQLMATPAEMLENAVRVGSVEDRSIPGPHGDGLPVRVYRPIEESTQPPPVIVYLHGGGWVFGGLDDVDGVCRGLSNEVGSVVVSVDYRLAPEHPFPLPVEDAYAAVSWVADNSEELRVDAGRLIIAGDSAGGNLAAAAALMARDRGFPSIAFQLLIYPVLEADFSRDSYIQNAEGYLLTTRHMQWFWDHYADADARQDPYAAPLRAADLSGLPPTHIVIAEYDVLRDEGLAYAKRLREAGVPVAVRNYPGAFHGFFGFGALVPVARVAFDDVVAELRSTLCQG